MPARVPVWCFELIRFKPGWPWDKYLHILHVKYVNSVKIFFFRRGIYRKWVVFQSILRGDHTVSASPRMCVWIPRNSYMLACRWTDSQSYCMSYWRLLGYCLHTGHLKSEFQSSPITETLRKDGLAISLYHIKWRHQIMAYRRNQRVSPGVEELSKIYTKDPIFQSLKMYRNRILQSGIQIVYMYHISPRTPRSCIRKISYPHSNVRDQRPLNMW